MSWRYYLQSMPSGEWISKDVPLKGGQVMTALSGPASISGNLPIEFKDLKLKNGAIAVREWGCLLVAEQEGHDPVCGIVDTVQVNGESLTISAGGFSMYPNGIPWLASDFVGVEVDPLDMVRKIWAHIQSYKDGNLGVAVDALKSPITIGEYEVEPDPEGGSTDPETGPFRLAWWATDDLGKVLADLFADHSIAFRERSFWDGEELKHRLELGYPVLGVRRETLRFEIGINVVEAPPADDMDYASEVLVFGAGEGRTKPRATAAKSTGRLRRVHVETDSSIVSTKAAQAAATPLMAGLAGGFGIDSVTVIDHENARFSEFEAGDEIFIQGDAGWIQLAHWVRIEDMTDDTDSGVRTLKVVTV